MNLKLELGTTFIIESERIEDWMVKHDGIAYGGFSLRIIRGRLREEERRKFDAHTGIREFKTVGTQTER